MPDQPAQDAPQAAPANPWVERTDYIRNITKWIIGAIAAAISLIVGTSPLTNFGSLEPGWRLALAVVGGLTGLAALGFAFLAAVEVLKARLMDINTIAEDNETAWLRLLLSPILDRRYPVSVNGIADLSNQYFAARHRIQQAQLNNPTQMDPAIQRDVTLYPLLDEAVELTVDVAAFELVRNLFERFCHRLTWAAIVATVGLVAFAWAANPAKPDSSLTKQTAAATPQSIVVELRHGGTPCQTQAAACPTMPTPPTEIPADCVTLAVSPGNITCIAQDAALGPAPRQGRVYALLRPGSLDLAELIARAIGEYANSGQPLPAADLARTLAARIAASFSDEFGKQITQILFARDVKSVPTDATPIEIWFSPPTPGKAAPEGERRGQSIDLGSFETDKSDIRDPAAWRAKLATLAAHATAKNCRIEITGFADRRGSARDNLYLAMQRASNVQRLLMASGLWRGATTLRTAGAFGTGCETDQPSDLACNRHVEIVELCPAAALE